MSKYEDGLYDQITKNIFKEREFFSDTTKVLTLLKITHNILVDREKKNLFYGEPVNLRDSLFRSYDLDLLDVRGGCGSYSYVLTKLLLNSKINARIGQMKCGNNWGCHIIVEANINGRWIVLDPTYNIVFRNQNNQIVGFKELNNNFDKFRSQVPSHYPEEFRYDDIRYTNWNKIILLSASKEVLKIFLTEEEINNISLRVLIMNNYKIYLIIILVIYFFYLIFTFCIKQKYYSKINLNN